MYFRRLIFVILTATISGSVFGGVLECENDSDCIDEASCVNNVCECEQGYVFSIHGDQCLQYSIGFGSSCEDDAQCSWLMGKYICNSGTCSCDSNYLYLHGRCIEKKGLGEECTSTAECHVTNDLLSMECSDGTCVCSEGYYARADYDCRPEITDLGEGCSIDLDCKTEGAVCSSLNECVMDSTSVRSYDEASVSRNKRAARTNEIGITCTGSEDCEGIEHSFCSSLTSECICERGYYSSSGSCIAEIGVDSGCTSDSDCIHLSFPICYEGACHCAKYAYHSDDLSICYRMARGSSLLCQNDMSCQLLGDDVQCVLNSNFVRACECPVGYQLDIETYLCVPTNTDSCGVEGCVTEDTCSLVNAICENRLCVCDTNFREEDNVCLPNLDAECDSNTKICEIENAACTSSICSCNEGYTTLNETFCIPVLELYENCEYDVECSFGVENSACINGECNCEDGYTDTSGECLEIKNYGDYCVNLQQCRVVLGENILCRNSICQCAADMTRSDDGLDCTRSNNANSISRSFTLFIIIFMVLVNA